MSADEHHDARTPPDRPSRDALHAERVVWRARASRAGRARRRPALLRVPHRRLHGRARDVARCGARDPRLARRAAREHWSDTQPPMFAMPDGARAARRRGDLKLYQPAHGRFYLVAAHLCCRRYGFPDRGLTATESVGFVLRRVERTGSAPVDPADPATYAELAWVPAAAPGPGSRSRRGSRWLPARSCSRWCRPCTPSTAAGRRLLTGLVPVGAPGALRGPQPRGARRSTAGSDPVANPHRALLDATVIDALRADRAASAARPAPADRRRPLEMLHWALLDLVDFIAGVAGARSRPSPTPASARSRPDRSRPPRPWAQIVKLVAGRARRRCWTARHRRRRWPGHLDRVRIAATWPRLRHRRLERYRDTRCPAPRRRRRRPSGAVAEPDPRAGAALRRPLRLPARRLPAAAARSG